MRWTTVSRAAAVVRRAASSAVCGSRSVARATSRRLASSSTRCCPWVGREITPASPPIAHPPAADLAGDDADVVLPLAISPRLGCQGSLPLRAWIEPSGDVLGDALDEHAP